MEPVDALARDIAHNGIAMPPHEWTALQAALREVSFARGDCIYRMEEIPSGWLFLVDGVTASMQSHADGSLTIARFFEDGQLCGNLTSTWSKQYASDELIAISRVTAVEIAGDVFRQQLLEGGRSVATCVSKRWRRCASTRRSSWQRPS